MGIVNEINSLINEKNKENEISKSNVILLKTIKSKYIIEIIFSFLYEKKKLNLMVYNKKFKEKLDINRDYYKEISGKINIGERNGIGMEYKLGTNILAFEGEYLNGKRNGKGKEYYENEIIKFEGEYLNGYKIEGKGYNKKGDIIFELNRNGKGKEYYSDGKIKFEGEYLNGKKWKGKGYNKNGFIEFIIEYGYGCIKEYNENDRLIFEGGFLNGERNGKGENIILKAF